MIVGPNNVGSKSKLGQKDLVWQTLGPKNFGSKKMFVKKKIV